VIGKALDSAKASSEGAFVMAAILEIPEVRQRVSPLSVADYHRLGEFNKGGRTASAPTPHRIAAF
jgi:hypothetical protein